MSEFRAGAARACITPPLGTHMVGYLDDRTATDVHDDLFAKALVLDNGDTAIALVMCDLIALPGEDAAVAKERVTRLTGIPQDHTFIACTHTHTGPATIGALGTPRDDAYMESAMERIADSVKMAHNRLQPAQVGIAATTCPGETFNRRWRLRDGTVRANFHVGHGNPEAVGTVGPTDPEVLVLAVQDRRGRPIALLANYSLHYVGTGEETAVSADYFGYFDRALQRLAGQQFVGIMANGCCGDVNNIDITRPRPESVHAYYHTERVANVLAAAAFGAWQGLRSFDYDDNPALGMATETMTFRRRRPDAEVLRRAEAILRGEPGADATGIVPLEFRGAAEAYYAREVQMVAEEPLERATPITAARVGPLGIVGLPGEVFVEYGLQIKQGSPFAHTMTIELANDDVGYCPTDKALAEGSYETQLARSSKAAPGTEAAMVSAALAALGRLR